MHRVTLKDIAQATGFSINTVSRALNDRPEINQQTKARICAEAEKLGYRPNRLAQALRQRQSGLIGVVVTDIEDPFFGTVVKSIQKASRASGHRIILQITDENPELEREAIQVLLSQHVDGVIICPVQQNADCVHDLERNGVRTVLVGRRFVDIDCSYVIPNDEQAGYLEAKHLIQLGHKKIGYVNASDHISSAQERGKGFVHAHLEFGVETQNQWMKYGALSADEGYALARELLDESPELTAIACFSDLVALGVLRAADEMGRSVPADLSVVGIDDTEFAATYPLSLTTVRSPKGELGRASMRAVCELLNSSDGAPAAPIQEVLDMELIVRKSSGPPGELS